MESKSANTQVTVSGLHHVAIRAEDFEQTIRFYTAALDFTVVHTWALPSFNIRQAAMLRSKDGSAFIEVFDKQADAPAQGRKKADHEAPVGGAILHLALRVTDAKAAYTRALEAGATHCIEPMQFPVGEPAVMVRNALIYGPNGEVIELLEEMSFR